MKAFLMIGQSNMAGRGDFEEVYPIDNPHIFMTRNGRWLKMTDPVNPDRSVVYPFGDGRYHSGVSMAPSFAEAYANYYGEDVGVIPCADGGTCISQWAKGEILFDHAVFQAKLAMRTSELVGIIWHQGESDSNTPDRADAYFDRLTAFFRDLREALGVGNIPVVMGELGRYMLESPMKELFPHSSQINCEIHRAAEAIGNAGVASSEGLVTRVDGIHFNSPSLRTFGRRYFEVYQKLAESKKG